MKIPSARERKLQNNVLLHSVIGRSRITLLEITHQKNAYLIFISI